MTGGEHPARFELEAYHAGEAPHLKEHLGSCKSCRAYIEALEGEKARFLTEEPAERFVHRPKIAAELHRVKQPAKLGRWALAPLVALAALAGLVLVLGRAPSAPQLTFKGKMKLAVIRKRGPEQKRLTGSARVARGDALLVELSLDRPAIMTVGVLEADGSWIELVAQRSFEAGVHSVSEDALMADEPIQGLVIAAEHRALERAGKDPARLKALCESQACLRLEPGP